MNKFLCSECGAQFLTKKNLNVHLSWHDKRVFNCDQCEVICEGLKSLSNHKKSHKTFSCDICSINVPVNSKKYHIDKCSRNQQMFQCNYCPLESTDKGNINKHQKSVHCQAKDTLLYESNFSELSLALLHLVIVISSS